MQINILQPVRCTFFFMYPSCKKKLLWYNICQANAGQILYRASAHSVGRCLKFKPSRGGRATWHYITIRDCDIMFDYNMIVNGNQKLNFMRWKCVKLYCAGVWGVVTCDMYMTGNWLSKKGEIAMLWSLARGLQDFTPRSILTKSTPAW